MLESDTPDNQPPRDNAAPPDESQGSPPDTIVADDEQHTVFFTGDPGAVADSDIVEAPQKLFAAEARVSGVSLSQWGRRLNAAITDWLVPHCGPILLAAAILLWLWITYIR
ncbi:MAG TPA: hypothetical protein VGK19_21825 [Capsulimonadaceae bacterium]|jgi:hypothetical protein